MSKLISQDSLPCWERMKTPSRGLCLPLVGRSMRQRQHCFWRSILRKVRSRMSFGGSGCGTGSTQTYSTLSSQSLGSYTRNRESSSFTTRTSLYSSFSHSLKRFIISASSLMSYFRDSITSCAALCSTISLHFGLLRKSVRMERKSGKKLPRSSFKRCCDISANFCVLSMRSALNMEKALFRWVFRSQRSLAALQRSSKGPSKVLGRRYFSMYFSMEVQRRQMSSCLSFPRKSEAQSKSSCGKELRIISIAHSITRYSRTTSAGLLYFPCFWAFLEAFLGCSSLGPSRGSGFGTFEGTNMHILSVSFCSSTSCGCQKARSSSLVAVLREWSNLAGLKVLRKSSQFWMYLALKEEMLPRIGRSDV